MCLKAKKTFWNRLFHICPNPKVAKEDIVVYKLLTITVNSDYPQSPFYDFEWKENVLYSAPLGIFKARSTADSFIEEGFHAFYSKDGIDRRSKYTLYEAIIPKGSNYFIGDNNDIVADRMKITKRLL